MPFTNNVRDTFNAKIGIYNKVELTVSLLLSGPWISVIFINCKFQHQMNPLRSPLDWNLHFEIRLRDYYIFRFIHINFIC